MCLGCHFTVERYSINTAPLLFSVGEIITTILGRRSFSYYVLNQFAHSYYFVSLQTVPWEILEEIRASLARIEAKLSN